ncbi:MAG TPA: hypothetical protein VGP99_01160, partial [Tepidisphaeraceae bacterium]|nr:hypothetical protein [Tepidisphaeraceae bacterium]
MTRRAVGAVLERLEARRLLSGLITNDEGESYSTIQSAIDGTNPGGVITLGDGTYIESNIVIDRALEIVGQSQLGVKILPSAIGVIPGAESSLPDGSTNIFLVAASNVSIHDLTIDGDNPELTGGIVINGADVDARNGIITDHRLDVEFNGLEVSHVTVKNIYLRGIYASSGGTFNFHHNTVDNVAGEEQSVAILNYGGSG